MKKPDLLTSLKFLAGGFAALTLILVVVYAFQRSSVMSDIEDDLDARAEALADRLEVMIRARAEWLSGLRPEEYRDQPVGFFAYGEEPFRLWLTVPETKIYTSLVETEETFVVVAVESQTNSFLTARVGREAVRAAMRDVWPGSESRVYLTNLSGRPFFQYPADRTEEEDAANQKFKRRTDALDGIGAGEDGVGVYQDLNDQEAVGAWRTSQWLHGGIVVERDTKVAFAEIRGLKAWHVTGVLLILSLVAVLVRMLTPKINFRGDLFRLYAYTKKYWLLISVTILVMGLYAAGNMVRLTLLKVVFEDVLISKGPGAIDVLKWVISVFLVIVVVMAVANWVKEYLTEFITQSTINDIRCSLMSHLMTLDMKYFDRQKAGELMSRLSNDVQQTRQSLSLIFGEFFQQPLMLLGAVGAAFITNWRLTFMVILGVPLIAFPIYRLGRLVKKYSKRRQVQRGVVTEVMLQTVSGVRTVKAFQMEEHENKRLEQASRRLLAQSVRVARTTATSKTLIDLMNAIGALLITAIGGYMVIYSIGNATPGDLVTLSVIIGHMYKPIKSLTKTYNKIQEALAGADRVFDIMDRYPEIADRPGAVDLEGPEEAIAFEDVSFAYDETPVLKHVSFETKVGSVVALVGETGSGKSTVTDLVARFYDPTEGRVAFDGRDLRDYRVTSVRKAISVVSQDAFLFNATVRENILYGRPGATEEEIVEAAKSARIHDEILKMDRGYRTDVGERGGRLSGGQRQRITIARAILKDAPILILDEATSALDSETESLVQEALNRLMVGRTTFVIAHRLSTIGHADLILVLKEGELVEKGSHEELLAREDGVYRTLHRIQFAGARNE